MTVVAVYTRLSLDLTHGAQTATSRQEAACRSFARARDWEVGAVFEDVDRSAADPKVERPAFEAMLVDVASGRFDGVLVWKMDRLVRRPSQFEVTWEHVERAGAFLASATEPVDTSNPLGLAVVRMLVTFASLETATQALRLRAKFKERADLGLPHGRRRAFGLSDDWTTLNRDEADLIREAAERVLSGASVLSIAKDWNRRGLRAPAGGPWTSGSLARVLRSTRVSGRRSHNGIDVAPGVWPAVLDSATSQRVRTVMVNPRHRRPIDPDDDLLFGLLICSRCHRRLRGRQQGGRPKRIYRCVLPPQGCGRMSVDVNLADATISEAFRRRIARMSRLQASNPRAVDSDRLEEELWALRRRFHRDGDLPRREFDRQVTALEEAARAATVATSAPVTLDDLRGWTTLPVAARRQLLASEIRRITVWPGPTHRRFDPARLEILWWAHRVEQLGCGEVAEQLGIGRCTAANWFRRGVLPGHKHNGEWRIDAGAFDEAVAAARIRRRARAEPDEV